MPSHENGPSFIYSKDITMYPKRKRWFSLPLLAALAFSPANAQLPSHTDLTDALKEVVGTENGGFSLNMWATIVDRDGAVHAVTFSGNDRGDQWPGSRVISAQKANTANAFSLPGLALSTANLFSAVQPGGSLFGLQFSNPVATDVAYGGNSSDIGTASDPMVGKKIGGVNVFGGGLPLYDTDGTLLGAIGLSGDSSCADHNIAWKLRHALNLDNVPGGVSGTGDDNIVYDIVGETSTSGWGHAACSEAATAIATDLPATHPVGPHPLSIPSQAPDRISDLTLSATRAKLAEGEVLGVYPNPFNSQTVIRFALPHDGRTDLSIYNAQGQKIADLVGADRQAGIHTVHWDGKDAAGQGVASGVYFYRLQAREHVEVQKLMLLR